MSLFNKLTVEQQKKVATFKSKFPALGERAENTLKTSITPFSVTISEALTIFDIFNDMNVFAKFDIIEFNNLFSEKENTTKEILEAIAKESKDLGHTDDYNLEIETKNLWIDLSYHTTISYDEKHTEIINFEVFDKNSNLINTDHITNEEIINQL